MSNMATRWNPQAILGVDPDACGYTCVGTTLKGQRCDNPVNMKDRKTAARLLDALAYQFPTSAAVHNTLEEIAELCLCIRNHRRNQVDRVVSKWDCAITEAFPPLRRERTSPEVTIPTRTAVTSTPAPPIYSTFTHVSGLASISTSATRPTTDPTPHTSDWIRVLNEAAELRVVNNPHTIPRDVVQLSAPFGRTHNPARNNPILSSSQPSRTSPRPVSPIANEAVRPNAAANITTATTPSTTQAPHTPYTQIPTHPTPSRRPTSSAVRRPISPTSECSICLDRIASPRDAVWCRASCGQNFHADCWAIWRLQQEDAGRTPSCGYCRAVWIDGTATEDEEEEENRVERLQVNLLLPRTQPPSDLPLPSSMRGTPEMREVPRTQAALASTPPAAHPLPSEATREPLRQTSDLSQTSVTPHIIHTNTHTHTHTHAHAPLDRSVNVITRRPLTGDDNDCGICLDTISSPDDAVWCRAQCGRNMHRGCFESWRESQAQSERESAGLVTGSMDVDRRITCIYCRAPWVE